MSWNLSPTVTWLEIVWTVTSIYIGFDALRWHVANVRTHSDDEPSRLAKQLIMAMSYYALTVSLLNTIAGLAAMTTGPAVDPDSAPTTQPPIASILATACLLGALVCLKVLLTLLTHYQAKLIRHFKWLTVIAEESDRDRERLQAVADSAVLGLEQVANEKLASEGKDPFPRLANVVPEHHSPATQTAIDEAAYQTIMARLVAARVILNLPIVGETGKR